MTEGYDQRGIRLGLSFIVLNKLKIKLNLLFLGQNWVKL